MTVLRRLLGAVVLLLVVSVLVFALIHAAPGGPLTLYLENPNVRPEDIVRLKKALGLDRSLAAQYLSWLRGFVVGEWGYSFSDGRPVIERLAERVPATLELMTVSLLMAGLVAVPAGVISAVRRGRAIDRLTTTLSLAGISLPVFWFGLVLQLIFAVALGWLPSSGRTSILGGGSADHIRLGTIHLACNFRLRCGR